MLRKFECGRLIWSDSVPGALVRALALVSMAGRSLTRDNAECHTAKAMPKHELTWCGFA